MASNQTFVRLNQKSKLNVQRSLHEAKGTEGSHREDQNKAGDFVGLPPLRSVTTANTEWPEKRLSPLNKWQIQRCSSSLVCSRFCQEERVNDFLHRNHIRVLGRLPRIDPFVLTNRGTDFSKYINFIYPPPFTLKLPSTEGRGSRGRNHVRPAPQEPKTPCPRLMRSSRSEREMFGLNPVVRVGGGYRRLSWKVLDVLPAIGQYDSDVPTTYSCMSCHAIIPVTEKVAHSRGKPSTMISIPRNCPGCGADPSEHRTRAGNELRESVTDTLDRGDYRFIIDHRHFDNSNEIYVPPATRVDWHENSDSYHRHMSRQSQYPSDWDLDTNTQSTEQKRSEADNTVFITEAGAEVDKMDVRRAWDNGSLNLEVAKDPGGAAHVGRHKRDDGMLSACDYEDDDFTDFEIIEDYDPQSGFSVRLRRRTFGSPKMADYFIHGFHYDPLDSENAEFEDRKDIDEDFERKHVSETTSKYGKKSKHAVNVKESDSFLLRVVQSDEEQSSTVRSPKRSKKKAKKRKSGVERNNCLYTVKLDQRDKLFDEDPLIQDKDVIMTPEKFSDKSVSDGQISLSVAAWDSDVILSGGSGFSSLSPSDSKIQEDRLYSSPLLPTTPQHDGYLADSEENADLGSLEAQIKKVRSDVKRSHTRNEERQAMKRKESKHTEPRDDWTSPPRGIENISGSSLLTDGEWDSEWESDFSLHVKPLSELSESSSEEPRRYGEHERRGANSSANITNEPNSRRSLGNVRTLSDFRPSADVGSLDEGARNNGVDVHTSNAKVRLSQVSRNYNLNPIPPDQPKPENSPRRPRISAPRSEDELSESDMKFFTQQLQAPYLQRNKQGEPFEEFPAGCRGMNCHRCGAFMEECQGVCSSCGTLCQSSEGPCKACLDVCETCNKPRYRCASTEKRSEQTAQEEKMCIDSEGPDLRPATQMQTAATTAQNCTQVAASKDDTLVGERLETDDFKDLEENHRKNKERKTRAPPKRKTKDLSNIKRVRGKRRTSQEGDDSGLTEERELSEEEPEETSREQTPVEGSSSRTLPSVFPAKPVRKAKPSKRILSQTVVYKGGDKQPSSETQANELPSVKSNEDLKVLHSIAAEEAVPSDEEESFSGGVEEPGETELSTEPRAENDTIAEQLPHDIKATDEDDVITRPCKTEETGEEHETKKREEQKAEEEKKILAPKLRGVLRVNAAFKDRAELSKRLQSVLKEATSGIIGQADMKLRKDSTIDYLAQYRLVDRSRLEMYGRAFTLEDEDEDGVISYEQMLLALEGVPSITGMSRKQLLLVLQILELGAGSRVTFKLFAVLSALCEKITFLDDFVKRLVEDLDLFDIECKLDLFKQMFFVAGDYSVTYITPDQLRIELKAGGLNQKQEDHVVGHVLQSTQKGQISFMDYMAYLPLFLSIHKNICDNALDMSRNKYQQSRKT